MPKVYVGVTTYADGSSREAVSSTSRSKMINSADILSQLVSNVYADDPPDEESKTVASFSVKESGKTLAIFYVIT